MRAWVLGIGIGLIAGSALAQGEHYVNGYTKADGTYVAPHYQTNPNATRNDNWSTQGNVNPYTGQMGTKAPDYGYRPVPSRGQSSFGDPSYNGSSFNHVASPGERGESSYGTPPPTGASPY